MEAETNKVFYPSSSHHRKLPANLQPGDEDLFGDLNIHLSESVLKKYSNVLVSDIGIIIKNLSVAREQIVCYDSDFINYEKKYIAKARLVYNKLKTDNNEKYFLAFDNYSGPNGFFHWFGDGMTRLVEMKEQLHDYTLLLPEYFKTQDIYRETLKHFDVKKVFYIPSNSCARVKNLYVASFIAPSGQFHPQNISKLSNFLLKQYNITADDSFPSLVYISRKKADRRFVVNEAEVIDFVERFGFTTICMEDYTLEEQIKMIHNAKCVISIHGAALTHIMFMRPGSMVMEFRKENDRINNVYFNLANAVGINYFYQLCKSDEIKQNANRFNLHVNPLKLEENLKLMLATTPAQ